MSLLDRIKTFKRSYMHHESMQKALFTCKKNSIYTCSRLHYEMQKVHVIIFARASTSSSISHEI